MSSGTQEENISYLRQNGIPSIVDAMLIELLEQKPIDPKSAFKLASAAFGSSSTAIAAAHALLMKNRKVTAGGVVSSQVAHCQDGLRESPHFQKASIPLKDESEGDWTEEKFLVTMKNLLISQLTEMKGSYIYCPICKRVTSDNSEEHIASEHSTDTSDIIQHLKDVLREPTAELILTLAVDFAKNLPINCEELSQENSSSSSSSSVQPFDISSIHLYTQETPIYRVLNRALRANDSKTLETWNPCIDLVVSALNKLPNYADIVYRGIDCAVDRQVYVPGKVTTWRAFSSSSSNARVARDFLGKKPSATAAVEVDLNSKPKDGTLFIITACSGKEIKKFSALQAEDEVLFAVNSQFRVKSILSGGSMKLLAQAMDVDLSSIIVYELRQVELGTLGGIYRGMSEVEQIALASLSSVLLANEAVPSSQAHTVQTQDSDSPVHMAAACIQHYPEVLGLFLASGSISHTSFNSKGRTVLQVVCLSITLFTDKLAWADPNLVDKSGGTAMTRCANHGWCEGVKALLQHGALVEDLKDTSSLTPLMVAAESGKEDCVDLLLECKANLHFSAPKFGSPLVRAAKGGLLPIVRRFLALGADANASTEKGGTSLFWAVRQGNSDMVSDLIQANADVNKVNSDGEGALMRAAECGYLGIMEILLDSKADVSLTTVKGVTVLDVAIRCKHTPVCEKLIAAGATASSVQVESKKTASDGDVAMESTTTVSAIPYGTSKQYLVHPAHPLIWTKVGKYTTGYARARCDKCRSADQKEVWHCSVCNIDICIACETKNQT